MSGVVLLILRILAAVALYAFICGTLYLLWRSLQQVTNSLSAQQAAQIDLLIHIPDAEERLVHFKQSNISIGRDLDSDCVLSHGTVSARHARLTFHHSQWWLDDMQSTNGTKLNDEALQMPTVVIDGDTFKCGQVSLTIILKNEAHANLGETE